MPGYGAVDHEYGMKLASTAPEDDGPVRYPRPPRTLIGAFGSGRTSAAAAVGANGATDSRAPGPASDVRYSIQTRWRMCWVPSDRRRFS